MLSYVFAKMENLACSKSKPVSTIQYKHISSIGIGLEGNELLMPGKKKVAEEQS